MARLPGRTSETTIANVLSVNSNGTNAVSSSSGIVKGKAEFGATVYGAKSVGHGGKTISYEALCRQIGKFFRTGIPPVSQAETLEIFAFMEAADESKRRGGKPVKLSEILSRL